MKKIEFKTFKKIMCIFLSTCLISQSVSLVPVQASSHEEPEGYGEIRPLTSCAFSAPIGSLSERLLADPMSEECHHMIDRIFRTAPDWDQIIKKALSSPAHRNLLKIGFDTCIAWDNTPEDSRTSLQEWEMNSVCRLIRIFWDSNLLISPPCGTYGENSTVKSFLAELVDKKEDLEPEVGDIYFDQVLFRLKYLGYVTVPEGDSVKMEYYFQSTDCAFYSAFLIAAFSKGGCPYLAECVWNFIAGRRYFRNILHLVTCSECGKYKLNDVEAWIPEMTVHTESFMPCKSSLMLWDKKFPDNPDGGMLSTSGEYSLLCPLEYIDTLEKAAVIKRLEAEKELREKEEKDKIREEKRKRRAEAKKLEQERKERKEEKNRQRQERKKQRKLEEPKTESEETEAVKPEIEKLEKTEDNTPEIEELSEIDKIRRANHAIWEVQESADKVTAERAKSAASARKAAEHQAKMEAKRVKQGSGNK